MLQAIYLGKLHTPLLPLFCTKKHMCCSSFGIKNEKHSTEDRSRFLFFSGASDMGKEWEFHSHSHSHSFF